MRHIISISFGFLCLSAAACTPPRSANVGESERAEAGGHHEALDPRLAQPAIIEASKRVEVLPGELGCSAEVLGLVDVHEPMKTTADALDLLKRRAAVLGAEAVVGVEFEHGEGGAEKTHLSGTAVRCKDLLHGRIYDVVAQLEVVGEMEEENEALQKLRSQATAKGANLILNVRFEHGDADRTKVTGTAVRAYYASGAKR